MGEFSVNELTGNREDQVGLQQWIGWSGNEVWELQALVVYWRRRTLEVEWRPLHGVAGKVYPLEEVGYLVPADAEGDLQHLRTLNFLTHGCVKTRAALLDCCKMKCGRICDGLDVVGILHVSIGSRNGGTIIDGDRLRERGAEVRVRCAAIANVPACVYVEVHEVGEATDVLRPRRRASLQSAKLIEVDWVRSFDSRKALMKVAWLSSSMVLLVMYCEPSPSRC